MVNVVLEFFVFDGPFGFFLAQLFPSTTSEPGNVRAVLSFEIINPVLDTRIATSARAFLEKFLKAVNNAMNFSTWEPCGKAGPRITMTKVEGAVGGLNSPPSVD